MRNVFNDVISISMPEKFEAKLKMYRTYSNTLKIQFNAHDEVSNLITKSLAKFFVQEIKE